MIAIFLFLENNLKNSVLMPAMDNKTVKISRSKETLFQEPLGKLFNTNNVSIMVACGVSLILITLMIVFACKLIRQRNSIRRISNCHNNAERPDDSIPKTGSL